MLWPTPTRERQGHPADAFEWERLTFIPGLDVHEDNSEEAWAQWDAAVRAGAFYERTAK